MTEAVEPVVVKCTERLPAGARMVWALVRHAGHRMPASAVERIMCVRRLRHDRDYIGEVRQGVVRRVASCDLPAGRNHV